MAAIRLVALAVGVGLAGTAAAQDYPTAPVRMIVPFAPGGTTDVLARIIAPAMGEHLGQNVLVENVGGAGGRIGTEQVSRADPDGYTLIFGNMGPMAASLSVFDDQTYDPRTDLKPVGLVAQVPMVLAASKASEVTSLEQFLDKLRSEGDAVNFGTAGIGATSDLAPALLTFQTQLEATRIPYQGAGPAIIDLTAGVVDAVIDQTVTLIPAHTGGTATALAVTGSERVEQLPDVPTFIEAGVPEFDMQVWNAVAAPPETPDEIVAKVAEAIDAALADERVRARFSELAVPVPAAEDRGPEALGALIGSEVERWEEIFGDATPSAN